MYFFLDKQSLLLKHIKHKCKRKYQKDQIENVTPKILENNENTWVSAFNCGKYGF